MDEDRRNKQHDRYQSLEWLLLVLGVSALTVTEQYRWYVTGGLILLAIAFLLRGWRTGRLVPRTGLEIPGLLFLISALVAAALSYDVSAAWLQVARILAGTILFYAVVDSSEATRNKVALGFVVATTALAIYWPLQHDFSSGQSKFAIIDTMGRWINDTLPAIPGPSIHSNVAAGTLLIGLPFGIAASAHAWRKQRWLYGGIIAGMTLVITGGLLLTGSRGAWSGLGGLIGLGTLVVLQRRWLTGEKAKVIFWLAILVLLIVVLIGLVAVGGIEKILGQLPDPTGTLQGRLSLWGQGLNLIRDYPYTGSGLMSFRMVYAIYGILIHVPHHDHLHNTYLEVRLEQGLFGAIGLIWGLGVVVSWGWQALRSKQVELFTWAGLAAILAASIHGIFDVVFYVTRTLPLIGLVAGFAFTVNPGIRERESKSLQSTRFVRVGLTIISLGLVLIFHRPLLSSIYANIGAIRQTKMELSTYDFRHFDDATLDNVRRGLDLSQVEADFKQALAWDNTAKTPLRRLAMIMASLGEYEESLDWAQRAWDAGYRDEITRLVYSDALTAAGQPEHAADVVRGLRWAEGRLAFQAWYRYWLGVPPGNADYPRCAAAWRAVLALNPAYQGAEQALEAAEAKLNP